MGNAFDAQNQLIPSIMHGKDGKDHILQKAEQLAPTDCSLREAIRCAYGPNCRLALLLCSFFFLPAQG